MKKFISLILAFAMVFSLAMPAMAAEDTRTIYFENTGNWSAVYAYAWVDSGTEYLGSWPGTAMTLVNGETNIYSIEVSTAATKVIFNNGGGSQTDDLTIRTDGNDLYSYGTGTWSKYAKKSGDVTASYTPSTTEPTYVSYNVMLKAIDSSTGAEITDACLGYLSSVAVDNVTPSSQYFLTGAHTLTSWSVPSGYKTPADVSLTLTDDGNGNGVLTSNSSHASVELVDGVYVITVTLETETTQPTIPSPIYFDNSVTNWGVVAVYFVDANNAYIKASDGSEEHKMSPVSGETNIYSAETPAGAVQVYFASGNECTVQTEIPTDGTNMFVPDGGTDESDFKTGTWGTYTSGGTTEPTAEAKWGASKDSLTSSGTLAEAIAAAEADSTVKYIQLQSAVTAESSFIITSGEFTIDLNGQTVTSDDYTFVVRYSGTKVTFADPGTTGAVTSEGEAHAAIYPSDGAEVLITGGSYSGYFALCIDPGTSAAITGGTFTGTDSYAINSSGTLTISGGTIHSGSWANVAVNGTTTITGGTFTGSGTRGNFAYWSGTLDLSGYSDVTGLKVSQWTGSDLSVSDENIKLPADYTFVDGSNNAVTTLTSGTVYTIAAVSGGEDTTAKITGVTVMLNGVEVPEPGDIKFTDSDTITVIYKGENFANLTKEYFYKVGAASGYLLYCQKIDTTSTPNTATVTVAGTDMNGSNRLPITYTNAGESAKETGYTLTYLKKGTELTTIYFNNGGSSAWTNVTAIFYNSLGEPVGTAELSIVPGESTVYSTSAIPAWAYTVKFLNETDDVQTEIPLEADGNNQFDLADSAWTKFKATEHTTTSANIVWGSMAFTYTDGENGAEGAWSNDGSDGAGTVTVTNTGTTKFTAQVAYNPETDYAEIEGSFDAASAELAAEASKTFTLTLKNQPAKAIPAGTKIGQVIITINKAAEG